jgi:CRP-like cAMP-binding protein
LISTNAVFTDRLDFFVEAVTTVTCSYCDRDELTEKLRGDPQVFDAFVNAMLSEKRQADQLATDLGRRSASERIARLVLYLKQRLEMRGLVHDNSFEIPLRQQHIADATGLTPVHVNRVLGSFRNDGVIETSDGKLKIISLSSLERVADVR